MPLRRRLARPFIAGGAGFFVAAKHRRALGAADGDGVVVGILRGVYRSTAELEADIRSFIELHNEDPKPYKWAKSADPILAAVKQSCQKANATLCGER